MKYLAALLLLLGFATPAMAHRLDEYLQATTIAVQSDRVTLQMHLTPGVAVLPKLLPSLDPNGDGVLSAAEQSAYAEQVTRDLSLTIDEHPAALQLLSSNFPAMEDIKAGMGEIALTFAADLPDQEHNHRLILQNRHQSNISVYLVNCLTPDDRAIAVVSQTRNYDQSNYQLDYTQTAAASAPSQSNWLERSGIASLFKAFFYQGVHHILTGYDHLLFVSALVLAATTLWDLIKVVSTFTLAHTLTLTLAALNVVHVTGRIVEPLIAASIVFVALQNLIWPRQSKGWPRLAAAFFFGLFHGLGFAGGLLDAMQQMPSTTMLLAIVAFSLGVEAGHQLIVLPLFSLLKVARHKPDKLQTRVRWSRVVRIGSAGISLAGVYYLCVALSSR